MATGLDAETLQATLDAVQEFAARELPTDKLLEIDRTDECPVDVLRAMCGPELGIHLLFIPEEFHGMGGGAFDVYRLCETLAGIDLGVATGLLATSLGSDPIVVGGTPEQKARWLTRIADDGLLMAYGATEPAAGSDLGALKSTATPIVERGAVTGYRLDGRKQWISNGGIADLYSVLANAPGGPTWFVVERGTPGLTSGKPEDKHGIRASNTAALYLEDVRVSVDDLVGGVEGQGLQQAQAVFGYTRLMVAAFGLGAGWAALRRVVAFATDRVQAGSPLVEKQGYTHKLLVPHAVRLEAARAFIEETAERLDAGAELLATEGAIAKYAATEAGCAAAEAAIGALGGYGYTREYLVEKIKRDVRITTIYEGTSEIMEMTIGRDRWQQHLKTRGRHYHGEGRALETVGGRHPGVGAAVAAAALDALGEVFERARLARLTRHQHVLLRLGELVAIAECAAALVRRAAFAAEGHLDPRADRHFEPAILAAMARLAARDAALRIATEGIRLVRGADAAPAADMDGLVAALGLPAIHAHQIGMLRDMDLVAGALVGRATPNGTS